MAKHQFHKDHRDGTKVKLEIFNKYFNECIPVFIHSPYYPKIFIYDLFAGQGMDEHGDYGTSLNILASISKHCEIIKDKGKELYIIFNDLEQSETLKVNTNNFLEKCQQSCQLHSCILENTNKGKSRLVIKNNDFCEYFNNTIYPNLSQKYKDSAKIIFLDPFNFIVNEDLFEKLTNLKTTDFICFMPSSYYKRFKDTSVFDDFINKDNIDFDNSRPNETHRVIAEYFDELVSHKSEYYIGHFSIKYETNYYGVIFGSNHSFGAEKFQKVCWELDTVIGEADYNIDRELVYGKQTTIFDENKTPRKIQNFDMHLEEAIKKEVVKTDVDAYKFALKNRCQPKHAVDCLNEMMNKGVINKFKTSATSNIHRIKKPRNIIYNETI